MRSGRSPTCCQLLVGDTDSFECRRSSIVDLPGGSQGQLFVGEADNDPLPSAPDPSPATLNCRPVKKVRLDPEVILASYVARPIYGLPVPLAAQWFIHAANMTETLVSGPNGKLNHLALCDSSDRSVSTSEAGSKQVHLQKAPLLAAEDFLILNVGYWHYCSTGSTRDIWRM